MKILVDSFWPVDPVVAARYSEARTSWLMYKLPIQKFKTERRLPEDIKEMPFVKDAFDQADDDVFCYLNLDNIVTDQTLPAIIEGFAESETLESGRWDIAPSGRKKPYPGHDWFGMTRSWWNQNRNNFPDMLFGFETWDCALHLLMRWTNPNHKIIKPPVILHRMHRQYWYDFRYKAIGNLHNLTTFFDWLEAMGKYREVMRELPFFIEAERKLHETLTTRSTSTTQR